MRVESWMTSLSWIPSESVAGWMRRGFDLRVAHYDEPPDDTVAGTDAVLRLRDSDRVRFGHVLSAWVEFTDGAPASWGYGPDSDLVLGQTTVRVATVGATFVAYGLPVLRPEPEVGGDRVRFTQTVGCRTGVPLPRPVPHPPFARWQAPVVWTTLALTLHADGRVEAEMPGASAFPRHWVYGPDGTLVLKSGLTQQQEWMAHSFGRRTPWGEQDSPALVTAAESGLERQLSTEIMRAGRRPEIRHLVAGSTLTRQGEPGESLFLVLDGVLTVDVDGEQVGEVGPGAILGERALLEGGSRTSTLVARTPVRVAVARGEAVDLERLSALARLHRREDE